jgi:nicotinamidase-related amidase
MKALLVIDMQVALVAGSYNEKEVLLAINRVISKVRQDGLPVFFIQHNHQSFKPMMRSSEGWQIHPELDRRDLDHVIEKQASDAFYQTDLLRDLKRLKVSSIIVTGMQSEYCVDATCRAALSNDLDVELIEDGHTTGSSHLSAKEIIHHHNAVLKNLAHPTSTLTLVNSRRFEC